MNYEVDLELNRVLKWSLRVSDQLYRILERKKFMQVRVDSQVAKFKKSMTDQDKLLLKVFTDISKLSEELEKSAEILKNCKKMLDDNNEATTTRLRADYYFVGSSSLRVRPVEERGTPNPTNRPPFKPWL